MRANPRPHLVQVLLDESECRWVSDQRSRPTALLNRVRQVRQVPRLGLGVRQVPRLGVGLGLGTNPNPSPHPQPDPSPDPSPNPSPSPNP